MNLFFLLLRLWAINLSNINVCCKVKDTKKVLLLKDFKVMSSKLEIVLGENIRIQALQWLITEIKLLNSFGTQAVMTNLSSFLV